MIQEMVNLFIIFISINWFIDLFFIYLFIFLYFLAEFRNYFEKYGKVLTSEVMFNRETHKSRGFGFVVYETEKSVDGVCAEKEHYIDGKLVNWNTFTYLFIYLLSLIN